MIGEDPRVNRKRIKFGVALLLFCGLAAGLWYYVQTPQFTMVQIVDSFEGHDLATFEKYVDIDGISAGVLDQYLGALARTDRGVAVTADTKQRLLRQLRAAIRRFVRTGRYPRLRGELRGLLPDIGTLRQRFRGIDDFRVRGRAASIGVQTRDGMGTLRFELRKQGLIWRVSALNGLAGYFAKTLRP